MSAAPPVARWRSAARRILLLAGLWIGLNGADGSSWIVGAPIVVLAAAVSLALAPAASWRIAPAGVLPFVLFFLRQSLAGGADVARRAIGPSVRLDPDLIEFPLRLPSEVSRTFFCGVVSLLPGTCVIELRDGSILLHALDRTAGVEAGLGALEGRVAALFGVRLSAGAEAPR